MLDVKLLLVDHATSVGSAQRALLDLVCGLPPSVTPAVMCPRGELRAALGDLGVRVLPSAGVSNPQRLYARRALQVGREVCVGAGALRRAAAVTQADIVHANCISSAVAASYARRLGCPPVVVQLHDVVGATWAANLARRTIGANADAIIANSEYTRKSFAEARTNDRLYTLRSPLDRSKFHAAGLTVDAARDMLGLNRRAKLVGLIAQITPRKGQETAIKAMERVRARHPQARLLLVGGVENGHAGGDHDNVSYERWLYRLVRALGMQECVEFWGPRNDIPIILRALDVLVAPSWEEPQGRRVIEAMSLGTPAIATAVGGPAEYIADGVDGLLVAPRDVAALATALTRLLGDGDFREQLGRRAIDAVDARFDRDDYVAKLARIYGQVLADQATPAGARR